MSNRRNCSTSRILPPNSRLQGLCAPSPAGHRMTQPVSSTLQTPTDLRRSGMQPLLQYKLCSPCLETGRSTGFIVGTKHESRFACYIVVKLCVDVDVSVSVAEECSHSVHIILVSVAEECLRCVHIILFLLKRYRFQSSVSLAKCLQGLIISIHLFLHLISGIAVSCRAVCSAAH